MWTVQGNCIGWGGWRWGWGWGASWAAYLRREAWNWRGEWARTGASSLNNAAFVFETLSQAVFTGSRPGLCNPGSWERCLLISSVIEWQFNFPSPGYDEDSLDFFFFFISWFYTSKNVKVDGPWWVCVTSPELFLLVVTSRSTPVLYSLGIKEVVSVTEKNSDQNFTFFCYIVFF